MHFFLAFARSPFPSWQTIYVAVGIIVLIGMILYSRAMTS